MTVFSAANKGPRDAAAWLSLAASPTFAFMAWIAANGAQPICSSGPVNGMTAMYLLMSLFHLPHWLPLARRD